MKLNITPASSAPTPFDRPADLLIALAAHRESAREPQGISNRPKHRQLIVDSKNEVPVQRRWSIHDCTPFGNGLSFSMTASAKTGMDSGKTTFTQQEWIQSFLLCPPEYARGRYSSLPETTDVSKALAESSL